MVFASCRLWSDNIEWSSKVKQLLRKGGEPGNEATPAVCVCVHANLGCQWGHGLLCTYACILGLVVSDKLEHQSSVKNKLTSPSSIIILRCSMTFGHTCRHSHIHTQTHIYTVTYHVSLKPGLFLFLQHQISKHMHKVQLQTVLSQLLSS